MSKNTNKILLVAVGGLVLGICLTLFLSSLYHKSSTNDFCMSCHVHPDSDASWKQSMHYNNGSGTKTDCAACHLPPQGTFAYFKTKAKTGMRDVWSYITKDTEEIDWEAKSELDYATRIVFNESCEECHVDLLPSGISDDGITAHLYYQENAEKYDLQCISCHLNAGHYNPNYSHAKVASVEEDEEDDLFIYDEPAQIDSFENFTETIPGTGVSMNMIAVPGGSFKLGSPDKEPYHSDNETPQRTVTVSSFFMGEVEVTWRQYWAFYRETMSEGRIDPEDVYSNNSRPDIDAVTGPTPPFGNPDQGWGMGNRPAITMTHYGAQTFCQWLSLKTGKTYRLPTEAEWEYAARGGTQTPYFFEGKTKKFLKDTTTINTYVVYDKNSRSRSQTPDKVKANPFGLKNMLGNVLEYCSDWYDENAYASLEDGAVDPKGPQTGKEHVVRGGLYSDDASRVRSAARSHTRHDDWLKTDPQMPKSIWWYSDIKGIGFRVVCEVPANVKQ